MGEVRAVDVPGGVADGRGVLDHQLERLALDREPRIAQVGELASRRLRGLDGRLTGGVVGLLLRGGPGGAVGRSAYLLAGLLDVDADHPGQLAGEGVDLRLVADARDQPGSLADRVDPAVGAVEVVLGDDVVEHEPVERHPAGDQLAHRRVALLDPQVAGVEPGRLDRDVGLGDEVLVAAEGLERGLLAGGVAVEGEDDLAAELLVVVEEPPQHPGVVVAEGGAAGRHGGAARRPGGRPSRRCSPRPPPPASCAPSRAARGRCRRAPGSSCRAWSRGC